jgi:hypothetical protein
LIPPPPIVIITVVAKWSLYIIYKTISWPTLQLYHIWPKNKYILLSTVAPITPLGNDAFSFGFVFDIAWRQSCLQRGREWHT